MRFHPALLNQTFGGGGGGSTPVITQQSMFTPGQTATILPENAIPGAVGIFVQVFGSNLNATTPTGWESLAYSDNGSSSHVGIRTSWRIFDGSETSVPDPDRAFNTGYLQIMTGVRTDMPPYVASSGSGVGRLTQPGLDYSAGSIYDASEAGGYDMVIMGGKAAPVSTLSDFDDLGDNYYGGGASHYAQGFARYNASATKYAGGDTIETVATNMIAHTISVAGPRVLVPAGKVEIVDYRTKTGSAPQPWGVEAGDLILALYFQEDNVGLGGTVPAGYSTLWTGNAAGGRGIFYYKVANGSEDGLGLTYDSYGSNQLFVIRNAGTPQYSYSNATGSTPNAPAGADLGAGALDIISTVYGGSGYYASNYPPDVDQFVGFSANGSGIASVQRSWRRANTGVAYAGGAFNAGEIGEGCFTISLPAA